MRMNTPYKITFMPKGFSDRCRPLNISNPFLGEDREHMAEWLSRSGLRCPENRERKERRRDI